jgi:hypothetical protein
MLSLTLAVPDSLAKEGGRRCFLLLFILRYVRCGAAEGERAEVPEPEEPRGQALM